MGSRTEDYVVLGALLLVVVGSVYSLDLSCFIRSEALGSPINSAAFTYDNRNNDLALTLTTVGKSVASTGPWGAITVAGCASCFRHPTDLWAADCMICITGFSYSMLANVVSTVKRWVLDNRGHGTGRTIKPLAPQSTQNKGRDMTESGTHFASSWLRSSAREERSRPVHVSGRQVGNQQLDELINSKTARLA